MLEQPAFACVIPGGAGHEQEITVTFQSGDKGPIYGYGLPQENQPRYLVDQFTAELPETWRVEDRGTRIEVHPSGRFYGGFDGYDVNAVFRACYEIGLRPYVPEWAQA